MLFLSALAGPHPGSPVVVQAPFPPGLPQLECDLSQVRIGWSKDYGTLPIDVDLGANFDAQAGVFESLGCRVEHRDIVMDDIDAVFNVLCYERTAADTKPVYEHNHAGLDARLAVHHERVRNLSGADFLHAHERRLALWKDVADAFASFDVLIWPNDLSDPCKFDDELAAADMDYRLLHAAPLLGLTAITVPCGFSTDGVPRGMQILGPPGADLLVAQVAYAYQQATGFVGLHPPG